MDNWKRILITIIAVLCQIFSFFIILAGNMTSAPLSDVGKITKGDNLNDVHTIMQNSDGDIYTLGYTCVQKFNASGDFVGGAYYDSNSLKHVTNSEFLSLNKENVVVLDCGNNTVYVFNNNFDLVEKIDVNDSYNKNDFYSDYPNTDAVDKELELSFFNSTVLTGNDEIQLDAPRNRLFSTEAGVLLLATATITLFVTYKL